MSNKFKEKQLEEMDKDIGEAIMHNSVVDIINGGFIGVNSEGMARELYDAGYRKQNEVIDTFVTRAKDSMELMPTVYKSFYGKMLDRIACEMKGGAE